MAQVWVGSLASYNAGRLYGAWIDVSDVDTMQEEIAALMANDPEHGEEWAIMDTDGLAGLIGEHNSLADVVRVAELVEEHGEELVKGVVEHYGRGYLDEAEQALRDNYHGTYDSLEDYAYEFIHDCYNVDAMGTLANYIDYAGFARDLKLGGDVFTVDVGSKVAVFSNT